MEDRDRGNGPEVTHSGEQQHARDWGLLDTAAAVHVVASQDVTVAFPQIPSIHEPHYIVRVRASSVARVVGYLISSSTSEDWDAEEPEEPTGGPPQLPGKHGRYWRRSPPSTAGIEKPEEVLG
ncbi:hypothetical protein NDU88_004489 [Pleurodeles waltl]|uniref:Uncharacterized protein n=1 Tax=Pleurodeles waltl TaxID=8319 RepID=A0AAV7QCU1_PLEWA|nr:hypothetical protein NDU88_004489 [Pleurodeles waltl]